MTAEEITSLLGLAEQIVPGVISLVKTLRSNGADTTNLDQMLAQANANDDSIIAKADAEIKKVDGL